MRKNNSSKLEFRTLRNKLAELGKREALTLSQKFQESIILINDFLNEVREQVTTVAFKDPFEEIYFFKFEKPEYYAQKIYHVLLFTLLSQQPAGTPDMIRAYLLEELAFISRFFKQYAFYYQYYRSGFTEMDERLFLRGVEVGSVLLIELPELDPEFCTAGDYLFAKFIAYELLQEYILDQLKKLDVKDPMLMPVIGEGKGVKKWFDWTGEVVNIVELGYALYAAKQLDGGKATLVDIFRWLSESFGADLRIPANRFREIRRRKRITRTHFLDLLKSDLLNYMDSCDEK